MRHLFLAALFCLSLSAFGANAVDVHGFVPPVLVSANDASIVVGDIVWRSADNKVYVVQAKTTTSLTLVDPASVGFVTTLNINGTEKVVEVAAITIDIPAPTAVATAP